LYLDHIIQEILLFTYRRKYRVHFKRNNPYKIILLEPKFMIGNTWFISDQG